MPDDQKKLDELYKEFGEHVFWCDHCETEKYGYDFCPKGKTIHRKLCRVVEGVGLGLHRKPKTSNPDRG